MAVHKYTRRKTGTTVYQAVYFGPDGTRRKEKAKTVPKTGSARDHDRARVAAINLANVRRSQVENGTWHDPREARPERLTFGSLVRRFLKNYTTRSGSMDYYEQRSALWLEHFGAKTAAAAIRVQDVDAFRKARSANVGDSTVRKDLVALSTLFKWGEVRNLVASNPADYRRVRRPSEPKHKTGYLVDDQEAALVAELKPWLSRVVLWAINTGMDRSEVLALTWNDVDRTAGVVHAPRAKTSVPREIPLNKTLGGLLKDAGRVRSVASGNRVFLSADCSPITVNAVRSGLRRAYKRAGFTPAGGEFKIFRHTFGARMAMADESPQTIATLMGHTTTHVTETYMHLSPSHLREAMERLDKRSA